MVDDDLLHHVRRGSGEPLILIHPLGAELVVWEPVLERLAAERDVIAVDMPGFGGSPPLNGGAQPTPEALAAALGRFMDALGIERAHVAGNSLGGWVALELAKRGRALSAAGLCSAGFWERPLGPRGGPDVRGFGRALLPVIPAFTHSAAGRRALLASSVGHPERVPPEAAARLVRSYVTAPGFEAANAAMRADVFHGVDEIDVPVTLAWGELDRLVRRPREKPEHWRSLILRDCGHIPTWDDPAQVSRALLQAGA
jgi:pimeloyl-ACP methyl ester carboxylesterase